MFVHHIQSIFGLKLVTSRLCPSSLCPLTPHRDMSLCQAGRDESMLSKRRPSLFNKVSSLLISGKDMHAFQQRMKPCLRYKSIDMSLTCIQL